MYKKIRLGGTLLAITKQLEGETIEEKVQRIMDNKEPIEDGAPMIYTERSEGVNPAYDIRTDRFEIAVDAMDKVNASKVAKREEAANLKKAEEEEAKVIKIKNSGAESTPGKADKSV